MDAPFRVALTSPAWKALLLLVSSQASPPSSQASFQKACMNFTDSRVPFELITTFLPLLSTSAPPKSHSTGEAKFGASPKVWPSVWPIGLPLALSFLPTSRYSSQVFGNSLAPTSLNHERRYATALPMTAWGTASHLPPTRAANSNTS